MASLYPIIEVFKTQQSKSIDYNNGTITQARMKVTYTGNGNIALYLTADGVNWEEVTNNVLYFFTNTGTDLRWKIEGSGVTITKIEISDYH